MGGSKGFFFEKKKQKTSVTLGHGRGPAKTRGPANKNFCALF
jgi:hypothetical protein